MFYLLQYVGDLCKSNLKRRLKVLQKRVANPKIHIRKDEGETEESYTQVSFFLGRFRERCKTLPESWMVGSSIHASLPPSPAVAPFLAAMTMEWCHSTRV